MLVGERGFEPPTPLVPNQIREPVEIRILLLVLLKLQNRLQGSSKKRRNQGDLCQEYFAQLIPTPLEDYSRSVPARFLASML